MQSANSGFWLFAGVLTTGHLRRNASGGACGNECFFSRRLDRKESGPGASCWSRCRRGPAPAGGGSAAEASAIPSARVGGGRTARDPRRWWKHKAALQRAGLSTLGASRGSRRVALGEVGAGHAGGVRKHTQLRGARNRPSPVAFSHGKARLYFGRIPGERSALTGSKACLRAKDVEARLAPDSDCEPGC